MLCDDCPDRETCTKLCEAAETYVDQDQVPQRELTLPTVRYGAWPDISSVYLTPREREILTLLGRGLTRADVCQVLEITSNLLRWYVHKLRQKAQKY